jgi:hypothetical protein
MLSAETDQTRPLPVCPKCKQPYRQGELACSNCGIVFSPAGRTKTIDGFKRADLERVRRVGGTLVEQAQAISLTANDSTIVLPVAAEVVLGRMTTSPEDEQPDVDLNNFNAHDHGVSHLHLKVIRKRDTIYVADLGSTNGSFLNGIKLLPKQERLLRSGDELVLGRLHLHVNF